MVPLLMSVGSGRSAWGVLCHLSGVGGSHIG